MTIRDDKQTMPTNANAHAHGTSFAEIAILVDSINDHWNKLTPSRWTQPCYSY
jgi:hypothetical protein